MLEHTKLAVLCALQRRSIQQCRCEQFAISAECLLLHSSVQFRRFLLILNRFVLRCLFCRPTVSAAWLDYQRLRDWRAIRSRKESGGDQDVREKVF